MSDTPTANRDAQTGYDTPNTDAMQWLSALVALIGLYLVASPFVFDATDAAIWNDTLVGTAIFLAAGYNFVRLSRENLASVGVALLAVVLGLWALVSPVFILMGSGVVATGTAISGLLVVVFSGYNAYANSKADAFTDEQPQVNA